MAAPTKKNKKLTMNEKVSIIKLKRQGKRNCEIARQFGVGESTVRMVYNNRDNIEKAAKTYGGQLFDNRSHCTNTVMIHMERYLAHYINKKDKQGVPLDGQHIKAQAKFFYEACLKKAPNNPPRKPFKASNGWLTKFLKRKEFKHVRLMGESASADIVAANSFPSVLKNIIEEGGYTKDQIYNLDESGLNWKRMPRSTYIDKQQKQARGRKVDKSKITVMFTVNVSGSYKMKPVFVHTAKRPHCFSHVRSMDAFDEFYWYKTDNAWMTSTVMKEWLLNHFVPDSRLKCQQLDIPFKILLLMDNAPCHPSYLDDLHPNVKIIFLPPNTTSLVQPLDQEIIANVKNFYYTRLFDYLREKTDNNEEIRMIEAEDLYGDLDEDEPIPQPDDLPDPTPAGPITPEMTVQEFWRHFTLRPAVKYLVDSWADINDATVHHAWRSLVPHLVPKEAGGQVQQVADSERAVVTAAQAVAGCEDVTAEEMREILTQEESPETVMQRVDEENQLAIEREAVELQPTAQLPQNQSMRNLALILASVDTLKESIASNDFDKMRVSEIVNNIDKVVRYYAEQHRDGVNKRTQTLITQFNRNNQRPNSPVNPPAIVPVDPPASPRPSTSTATEPDVAIDEADFEGFMHTVDLVRAQAQGVASSTDSDEDEPGPQSAHPSLGYPSLHPHKPIHRSSPDKQRTDHEEHSQDISQPSEAFAVTSGCHQENNGTSNTAEAPETEEGIHSDGENDFLATHQPSQDNTVTTGNHHASEDILSNSESNEGGDAAITVDVVDVEWVKEELEAVAEGIHSDGENDSLATHQPSQDNTVTTGKNHHASEGRDAAITVDVVDVEWVKEELEGEELVDDDMIEYLQETDANWTTFKSITGSQMIKNQHNSHHCPTLPAPVDSKSREKPKMEEEGQKQGKGSEEVFAEYMKVSLKGLSSKQRRIAKVRMMQVLMECEEADD